LGTDLGVPVLFHKSAAVPAAAVSMLITMGCSDQCPIVPGVKRDEWPLEDPKGKPLEVVRASRDEIRERVQELVESQGWPSR
jgi:arsenate reductase (thioredoxin)